MVEHWRFNDVVGESKSFQLKNIHIRVNDAHSFTILLVFRAAVNRSTGV
jgi:hypothetical protein